MSVSMDGTAAAKKRGRKPARESRSDEIRQRVAEWKSQPAEERRPLTELARELGVSHQLASYYASRMPEPASESKAQVTDAERHRELMHYVAELARQGLRVLEKRGKLGARPTDFRRLRRIPVP